MPHYMMMMIYSPVYIIMYLVIMSVSLHLIKYFESNRTSANVEVISKIVFRKENSFISTLARACGVPAVGVRAADCWQ